MIVDPEAPPPDPPLSATVARLRPAYPASVLAGSGFAIPVVTASALLPDVLAWAGYGAALSFTGAAALAASRGGSGAGRPVRAAAVDGMVTTLRRWRPILAVTAAAAALALPLVGSVAFLTGIAGLGLFAVFLTVLWAILVVGRGALLVPVVVLRDLGPTDAFDLATSLIDGVVVETAGIVFIGLLVAVGPPIALGLAGLLLGWPVIPTAAAAGLALGLGMPPTAIALGIWLDDLEAHRRRVDPGFGRP